MPRVARRHLVDVFEHQLTDFPRGLAFSSDGALLAVGAADGAVSIFRAGDGTLVTTLRLAAEVSALAFAPTTTTLAVASHDGLARLFDAMTGAQLVDFPSGTRAWAGPLAWSPDGVLAVAAGKQVRLWRANGSPLLETPPHESTVTGVAFSRDGRRLFTSSYGGVREWPVVNSGTARRLEWKGSLLALAVSPDDGVVAAASQDCSVHFWRLEDGSDSEMSGYSAKPTALAWSADSALLATGGGENICVWRFEGEGPEGTKPLLLKGHEQLVTQLAFATSERLLASAGEERDILLWDLAEGLRPSGLAPMEAAVAALRFSPDDALVAAADETGLVRVFKPVRA